MSLTLALVGLATALVPLLIFWVTRRKAPTSEERRDDIQAAYREAEAQIATYEAQGNYAEADALRDSLRSRALAGRVPHPLPAERDAGDGDGAGQRVPPETPGWDAVDPR